MEAIEKFATGSSSVEDFARHVRIKSLLANQLGESIRAIQRLWVQRSESIDAPNSISDFDWIQSIERLTDAIEAMFLHGLRAKLSLSRMLAPAAKFSSIASPSVSTSNASFELIGRRLPDFWPVLLILSHNQVSEELKTLCNVRTDIGRCRAWIRLALNESLLPSYFETLINDTSLLHGFYRPYAFLRDKQQTARLCHLLTRILDCIFNLPLNEPSLNCWSATALRLIGIDVPDRSIDPTSSNQDHKNKKESKYEEKEDDEQPDHLKPVMPAIDALQMLSSSPAKSEPLSVPKISRFFSSSRHKEAHVSMVQSLADEIQQASTPKLPVLVQKRPGERDATETVPKTTRPISSGLKKTASGNSLQSRLDGWSSSPNEIRTDEESDITTALTLSNALDNSTSQISIKGRAQIDMSSSNNQKIPTQRPHYRTAILADEETSYNSLLNSYSKGAVLSTTPDLHDIYFRDIRLKSTSENDQSSLKPTEMATATSGVKKSSIQIEYDFDLILKSQVLDENKPEAKRFLHCLTKIMPECGLDEQDYKCVNCGRPIGMIYGKARVCKLDGSNYCLDCHQDDKAIIPARIVHNWDFNRYVVSKSSKRHLELTEQEPLLDLKKIGPLLYELVPPVKECFQLRTQLFYLHAYLFTCQEQVALELRRMVWPNDHLFEHIHLYSTADLIQVQSGQLMISLRRSIQSARKHVVSCALCSQKGFICEICRSPQIIYPFDIDSTYRCDVCKAVFHRHCIVVGCGESLTLPINCDSASVSSEEIRPCPRCIRIRLRESNASSVTF